MVIVKDLTPKHNGVMDLNSFEILIKQEKSALPFLMSASDAGAIKSTE